MGKDHRLKLRKREARKLRKQNDMISRAADRGWQGHTKGWAKDDSTSAGKKSNGGGGGGGGGAEDRQDGGDGSGISTLKAKQAKLKHESAELSTMSDSARLEKLKKQVDANPALKMNEGLQKRIIGLEEKQQAEQEAWAERVKSFVKAKAEENN